MTTHRTYMQSSIGWILLEATDTHLCKANWVEQPDEEVNETPTPILAETIRQLKEYFAGERTEFNLPLQQEGTAFQQKVWNELLNIPHGQSITYQELAARAGNPKAYRAAGSANGKNAIFIIVPCHRVVQSGGKTGGYAYGTEMKQFLLDLENRNE